MKTQINWDVLGVSATVACAIHCAILPLFLTSLPLFGFNIIHNIYFEIAMVLVAVFIGGFSLWHGYKRHHHRLIPLIIFLAGMILLVTKLFFVQYEYWIMILVVIFITLGHFLNWRYCRLAKHCHTSDCNH